MGPLNGCPNPERSWSIEALRRSYRPERILTVLRQCEGTAWRLGVSGRNRCLGERIVGGLESLSEAGAERAIMDGAANLKHKIRPSPRPAHLLRFVHPAVHRKLAVPSVIAVPTRNPARYRSA